MSRLFLVEDSNGAWEVLKQIDPARRAMSATSSASRTRSSWPGTSPPRALESSRSSFVGRVDGQLAYTMPYCEGGSLRDRLEPVGEPVRPHDAARLVVALARTVQKLQEEQPPIVHRDLKPENVLFPAETSDWTQPLIADLGLAKVLGREGPTRSGAVLGTWVYMAPEQVRDPARRRRPGRRLRPGRDPLRMPDRSGARSAARRHWRSFTESTTRRRLTPRNASRACRRRSTRSCRSACRRKRPTATPRRGSWRTTSSDS